MWSRWNKCGASGATSSNLHYVCLTIQRSQTRTQNSSEKQRAVGDASWVSGSSKNPGKREEEQKWGKEEVEKERKMGMWDEEKMNGTCPGTLE